MNVKEGFGLVGILFAVGFLFFAYFVLTPQINLINALTSSTSKDAYLNPRVGSIKLFKNNAGRAEYSPDGSKIMYHAPGADGLYDVYVFDIGTKVDICITCKSEVFQSKHAGNASWHPGGEWIAFQAEMDNYKYPLSTKLSHPGVGWFNNIWVTNINSETFVQVTDHPGKNGLLDSTPITSVLHPHFSSDGNQISWSESVNNNISGWKEWRLVVANFAAPNGPQVENFQYYSPQNIGGYYESDDFSRDSKTLLISANLEPDQRAIGMDIYSYNIEANTIVRLTDTLTDWDELGIYSPDSSEVVWLSSTGYPFNAESIGFWWAEGHTDYWLMDADGSNKTQLTYFNKAGTLENNLVNGNRVISAYIEWHPSGKSLIASVIVDENGTYKDKIFVINLKEEIRLESFIQNFLSRFQLLWQSIVTR